MASYSRLIGADEGGTLERLRALRPRVPRSENRRIPRPSGQNHRPPTGYSSSLAAWWVHCAVPSRCSARLLGATRVYPRQARRVADRHRRGGHCRQGWRHLWYWRQCRGPARSSGTIMLVCAGSGARPGIFDWFGHGISPYHPFFHPPSGKILMRVPHTAAQEYLLRAGCYVAPEELQNADR